MNWIHSGFLRDMRATGAAWLDDNCSSRAAALSYYTTFSIAPILVIAVAIASFVFERDAVLQSLLGEARRLFGEEGAGLIERLLLAARDEKNRGLAAAVAGVGLLVGATTAFAELKDGLDAIWRVPKSRISGIRGLLRARLLSFGLVLSIGFLLLVSLLLNAAVAALSSLVARWFGLGTALGVQAASAVLSLLVVGVLFAIIFKVLPTIGPSWRVAGRGALLTTALFLFGRAAIGAYLGNAASTSSFGAAGSLAVLLLWVYYSALIFYFGAEYTHVTSERGESERNRPAPSEAAELGSPAAAPAVRKSSTGTFAVVAFVLFSCPLPAQAWFCSPGDETPAEQLEAQRRADGVFSAFKDNDFVFGVPKGGNTPGTWSRFQLSVKANLLPTRSHCTLFVTWSQQSLWGLYDGAGSYPFIDTNYNPGLFLAWRTADRSAGLLPHAGLNLLGLYLGFEHESNGRSGLPSRNWNRLTAFARLGYRWDQGLSVLVQPMIWYPSGYTGTAAGGYDPDGGGNPDLIRYFGYGQLGAELGSERVVERAGESSVVVRNWAAGAVLRVGSHAEHLALELTARVGLGEVPLLRETPFALFFQCSLWNGEVLLSYAQSRNVCRLGFVIEDRAPMG